MPGDIAVCSSRVVVHPASNPAQSTIPIRRPFFDAGKSRAPVCFVIPPENVLTRPGCRGQSGTVNTVSNRDGCRFRVATRGWKCHIVPDLYRKRRQPCANTSTTQEQTVTERTMPVQAISGQIVFEDGARVRRHRLERERPDAAFPVPARPRRRRAPARMLLGTSGLSDEGNTPRGVAALVRDVRAYAEGEEIDFSGVPVDLAGVDDFRLAIVWRRTQRPTAKPPPMASWQNAPAMAACARDRPGARRQSGSAGHSLATASWRPAARSGLFPLPEARRPRKEMLALEGARVRAAARPAAVVRISDRHRTEKCERFSVESDALGHLVAPAEAEEKIVVRIPVLALVTAAGLAVRGRNV